ncbi:MAG: M6 family metalloprotease domain-containing protein [Porphyromonadaceae bacterium]|nr:M6 family metalloprotease domain-containing protein [Porphyromonadaceae bacterium]
MALLLLGQTTVSSAPADRVIRLFTQPDGTTVTIVLQGDEHFNFYTTTDGFMLFEDTDGYMRYANVSADHRIFSSGIVARDPEARTEAELDFLKSLSIDDFRATVYRKREASPLRENPSRGRFPSKGSPKGLILLVQYLDEKFSFKDIQKRITAQMNEKGYNKGKATGSAYDYFYDQSHGQFTPSFDVYEPITLSRPMVYYGQRSLTGHDAKAVEMVVEACELFSQRTDVDFSQYDNDNDGFIDLVFIIYAGYNEAQGGPSSAIWAHAWTLMEAGHKGVKLGDKKVDRYACTSELRSSVGTMLDGIGTFCHEFTHCFGLPDFYDTGAVFRGNYGVGRWSLMDRGSYNNNSHTPAGYTSYERVFVGWLEPTQLTNPVLVTLEPINTHNQACIIYSDKNPNEYFLIENRQKIGWDAYLPGNGLMITHVDYSKALWDVNAVNRLGTASHPHLQIVAADNDPSYSSEEGDLFPGTLNKIEFTDTSIPAASLYSGGFLGKPITGIVEQDQKVTFSFMGGKVGLDGVNDSSTSISLSKGVLHLTMPGGQMVKIYNMEGQEILNFVSVNGKNSQPLPMGAYVVRVENKTYKVIVP